MIIKLEGGFHMNGQVVLNANAARASIAKVSELVGNMGAATRTYKSILENEYEKSNLGWMRAIVTEAGKLEDAITVTTTALEDLNTSMARYTNQVEGYSDDTTGL